MRKDIEQGICEYLAKIETKKIEDDVEHYIKDMLSSTTAILDFNNDNE